VRELPVAPLSRWFPPEPVVVLADDRLTVTGNPGLTTGEIEAIIVPGGELAGYDFVHPDQVAGRVAPLVARRIAASLEALAAGTVASLAAGSPTG
jgi:hypothetical protein